MANSCCGVIDLQKACVVTGTLEVAFAGAFLLYDVGTLAVETPIAVEERNIAVENPELDPYRFHTIRVVLAGMNAMFWLGCMLLGIILVIAAKQRDLRRLRSWYILTCILTVLFVVDILMEAFSMRAPIVAILSPTLGMILQCYMLWIVTEFMDEVSRGACALPVKASMEIVEEEES